MDNELRGHFSGDIGDCLLGVQTIRKLGITKLYLDPEPNYGTKMGEGAIRALIPLLRSQGINAFQYTGKEPIDIDLDQFRDGSQLLQNTHLSLCIAHRFDVNIDVCEKYISVEPKRIASVVIHESDRYNNNLFDWQYILKGIDDIIVVGMEHEAVRLMNKCGRDIRYVPTTDFLELAQIISGCDVFIGNQSSPFAIAEGMKKNRIQETYRPIQNALPMTFNGLSVITELQLYYAKHTLTKKWLP